MFALATGNSGSSWTFLELVIDQSDASGSWKKVLNRFLIALEL